MYRIAVLLTCHNRKAKTLSLLDSLKKSTRAVNQKIDIAVYLTDDGSTDGTSEAVRQNFPDTIILKGDGNLFWANGMINSWSEAIKGNFDFFLLLNDDAELFKNAIDVLLNTHLECKEVFKQEGVYVGSTLDKETQEISYGGAIIENRFKYTFSKIIPDGRIHLCDLGNANIMMVSNSVVEKVGILSQGYTHGAADFDYTLKCRKKNIPVLVAPKYCGYCTNDHKGLYHNFHLKSFRERLNHLRSPTGIAFSSRLLFMKRFFPFRYPIFYLVGWFKVLFPKAYVLLRHNK